VGLGATGEGDLSKTVYIRTRQNSAVVKLGINRWIKHDVLPLPVTLLPVSEGFYPGAPA
jgi:hypothetical protein